MGCSAGNPKPPSKKSAENMRYARVIDPRSVRLTVRTSTWLRDANGLFDYECNNPLVKDIKIAGNGNIGSDRDCV